MAHSSHTPVDAVGSAFELFGGSAESAGTVCRQQRSDLSWRDPEGDRTYQKLNRRSCKIRIDFSLMLRHRYSPHVGADFDRYALHKRLWFGFAS
jgi:hypothetical protein